MFAHSLFPYCGCKHPLLPHQRINPNYPPPIPRPAAMGSTVRDTYELIPSTTRSAWRNTYIYASNDPDTVLGGLYVTVNMSNKNLYRIVEILCSLVDRTFHLEDEGKEKVARDESGAKPGKYYIAAQGKSTLFNGHQQSLTLNRSYHYHKRSSTLSSTLEADRNALCGLYQCCTRPRSALRYHWEVGGNRWCFLVDRPRSSPYLPIKTLWALEGL